MKNTQGISRLDVLLVERGLIESRERAKAIVMSGSVYVNGIKATRAAMKVSDDAKIDVKSGIPYVSRGGFKLQRALEVFDITVTDKVCLDCGASTGGFTDCLLQNGAKLVYAVDVGYGQLSWNLRNNPHVVVMERTNIRYVTPEMFDLKPELITIDLSFISLSLILPCIKEILACKGDVISLIKPQFEAGREKVGKKGVVRDPEVHKDVLNSFIEYADKAGFALRSLTHSPIKGPEGNVEFLAHLDLSGAGRNIDINTEDIVETAHDALRDLER